MTASQPRNRAANPDTPHSRTESSPGAAATAAPEPAPATESESGSETASTLASAAESGSESTSEPAANHEAAPTPASAPAAEPGNMPAVSFVSLGPGDPELITLKGFRKLQEAEVIFCPAGGPSSRAARILKALDIPEERILPFALPMGKDRRAAFQAYDRVYEQAAAASREGRKAVIVAEGDAGFYSSTQYICDRLAGNGIPVERTAGVPAFIAAGAVAGLHIVKQNEPLQVLPGEVDTAALLQSLERGVHTVIMKLPQSEAAVKACIRQAPRHGWHYFEHVGTGREFYTCDCETILQRPFPYFSLMLVLPDNPVR